MLENGFVMNEVLIRAQADTLILSLTDIKAVQAFQLLLSCAKSLLQLLLIIDLIKIHKEKPRMARRLIIGKVCLLGQVSSSMSERIALMLISMEIVSFFFQPHKNEIVRSPLEQQPNENARRNRHSFNS